MKLLTNSVFALSIRAFIFSAMILSALSPTASAQSFPEPQDKYVNDFAGFLGPSSVSQLKSLFSELERNTTAEVVMVTVETTAPLAPAQYRTELFNNWKIGKSEKDNGLLILYAAKEKRIEVETGYGLEGILPDSKVGAILDEFYVPYRDKGETQKGIVLAAEEFARVITENADEVRAGNAEKRGAGLTSLEGWIAFFGVLLFPIILFFAILAYSIYQKLMPLKCPHDGTSLMYLYADGAFDVYVCKRGHQIRKRKSVNRYSRHAGFGGGFGGGSGGGGGGFGGGGSGGGGAGR